MKEKDITEWIRGLQEAAKRTEVQNATMKNEAVAYLLGYIDTSKYLI